MRLRSKIYWILLLGLSTIIVARRLAWDQVPTQVPSWLVWGTIFLNCAVLAGLARRRSST